MRKLHIHLIHFDLINLLISLDIINHINLIKNSKMWRRSGSPSAGASMVEALTMRLRRRGGNGGGGNDMSGARRRVVGEERKRRAHAV
jgi:hypothetical protein